MGPHLPSLAADTPDSALQVYLLGPVAFEIALALQRFLVYRVSGDRTTAALVLCEHPPYVSVGRQGSRAHILCEADELRARRWPVRWVNRGGGCTLHGLGQLAVYPVLPLDRLGLSLQAYLDRLQEVVIAVLADFTVSGQVRVGNPGVWVGNRLIADVGVAVRDWVTYYGAYLNVAPDLEPFRRVRCGGPTAEPMTSLVRERRGPVRPSMVRERLIEHFATRFGFARTVLFTDHAILERLQPASPLLASSG